MLSFLLVICTLALGFLGYTVINYSLIIYAIMVVFLCSPMIPDMIVYRKSKDILLLVPYFMVNIATYASLAPMMLRTVLLGAFGKKAVFTVTPKQSENFSFEEIIRYSWDSVLFATAIGVLSFFACGSILPVIFIAVGCALAPFIIALSNISVRKKPLAAYIPAKKSLHLTDSTEKVFTVTSKRRVKARSTVSER